MHINNNGILEFSLKSKAVVNNPFWDIETKAIFRHEKKSLQQTVYGFYDDTDAEGNQLWKFRWSPSVSGDWSVAIDSIPVTEGLNMRELITVSEEDIHTKGFLRADHSHNWGFRFDNGDPYFLFGDTIYNLFGAHYCGVDVDELLRYRKAQGINYIRARMQVSPYHPETRNSWQTKDCWPWGGSSQLPVFSRLNIDYFRAVDEVMDMMISLDMGLEVIFEAWLWEFPFNDRNKFTTEHEEMWFRYIVARYAAYSCVYIWCPANEYEFYPVGEVKYHPEADRWLNRLAGLIRESDPYRHPIGAHNWEQTIPMSKRIGDLEDIDVFLIQTYWNEDIKLGRNTAQCINIEQHLRYHAEGASQVSICAEFGYEKVKGLYTAGAHQHFDEHHTRRGQWKAGFSGYPVIHGFDNTWGAHMRVDIDAKGAASLPHFYRFMTEIINFDEVKPSQGLLVSSEGNDADGSMPLCIADQDRKTVAVYFPTFGNCRLDLPMQASYKGNWFNPRNGQLSEAFICMDGEVQSPSTKDGEKSWNDDWVLLLNAI